jgi:hypothetical protein
VGASISAGLPLPLGPARSSSPLSVPDDIDDAKDIQDIDHGWQLEAGARPADLTPGDESGDELDDGMAVDGLQMANGSSSSAEEIVAAIWRREEVHEKALGNMMKEAAEYREQLLQLQAMATNQEESALMKELHRELAGLITKVAEAQSKSDVERTRAQYWMDKSNKKDNIIDQLQRQLEEERGMRIKATTQMREVMLFLNMNADQGDALE